MAIINDDIGKFGYDSMQQRTKIMKITFKAKFFPRNLCILQRLACRLRSSCLYHDVNNGVKCK